MVKKATAASWGDEDMFGGHSLRATDAGVEEQLITNQTRHKLMTVLRHYIRDSSLFWSNAARKVGL